MTKNEFKLRALLAMCSNPEYVDDSELDMDSMIVDARELADLASRVVTFDDDFNEPHDSTKRLLYDTCAAIEEISQPDGKLDFMIDTLRGIEKSLYYMNNQISKIIVEDEEEAEDCDV